MGMKRNGVAAAVRAELTTTQRLDSALGRTAMVLAQRLDDPETPATAVAAMAKELRSAMADLGADAKAVSDPLDELRKRREANKKKPA